MCLWAGVINIYYFNNCRPIVSSWFEPSDRKDRETSGTVVCLVSLIIRSLTWFKINGSSILNFSGSLSLLLSDTSYVF